MLLKVSQEEILDKFGDFMRTDLLTVMAHLQQPSTETPGWQPVTQNDSHRMRSHKNDEDLTYNYGSYAHTLQWKHGFFPKSFNYHTYF